MTNDLYDQLQAEGIISEDSREKIRVAEQAPAALFSLHREVQLLLYLGVLLLTSGLGLLIYDHIDTLGHQFVLALISAICIGCFYYCFKHRPRFSKNKVLPATAYADYVLLLGAISFSSFIGYLQFAYNVFGAHYGLATLVPTLFLFYLAYDFDHQGILGMAVAGLAVWMGISITPKALLLQGNFSSERIIYTYIIFGGLMLGAARATIYFKVKPHFKFSYHHYGVHVTYIALLAGFFYNYEEWKAWPYLLALAALSLVLYKDAFKERSFYFVVLVVLYSYIAVSSAIVRLCTLGRDYEVVYLLFMYFIGTAVGFILLLIHLNHKLNAK